MWLLPVFSLVSRLAARVYYRVAYLGGEVPSTGPVLLVANHPNSLLDPVLVIAAARRPVRFLAKAPLFQDPKVGWLVRGSGSIPVYRPTDDPTQLSRNEEMFSAVEDALASGAAVALFPEGISHSLPSLSPLKTGAARIALGFAARNGVPLHIVPLGLVFREKDRFRSQARVQVGVPVPWHDLADRGRDPDAVVELTERLDRGLRGATVNLEDWADRPLVECALDVWEASLPAPPDEEERVGRTAVATQLLASVRAGGSPEHRALVDAVRSHERRLHLLGLRPRDLGRDTSLAAALRWSLTRAVWISPPAVLLGGVGTALFWVPLRATGWIGSRFRPDLDQRATYNLLVGFPVYGLWIAGAAVATAVAGGMAWGLGVLTAMPLIGAATLRIREAWRQAWSDARGYVRLRSRRALVEELARGQDRLARQLDLLHRRLRQSDPGPSPDGTD